ncbi:hypothetical protein [Ekhidna sp.]|jgi:hypothetical protein|uniref:hypothetical protein n=1 Tax=Ekhidna sp. TaxID=2608089 RepID=UPI0032EAF275
MKPNFNRIYLGIRNKPIFYRFTLGVSILLSIGFIPTGFVKLLGLRFTSITPEESMVGAFFDLLYRSNYYWRFIGLTQIIAGITVLFKKTLALGAILFVAISLNILFITISYGFGNTVYVAIGLVLASLWLCYWEWNKLSVLFLGQNYLPTKINELKLSSRFESIVYILGFTSGLLFFSVLRGLVLPMILVYISVFLMIGTFITSIVLGIKFR